MRHSHRRPRREAPADGDRPLAGADGVRHRLRARGEHPARGPGLAGRRGRALRGGTGGSPRVARAVVAARRPPPLRRRQTRDRARRPAPRARQPPLHPLPHVGGAGLPRGRLRRGPPVAEGRARAPDRDGRRGSFAQVPPTLRQDAGWRQFVADMEREGVRFCYTDFFLATRVNFLSRERIVCSAKLGPTTTEYFFEYRERVERRPRPPSSPSTAPPPGGSRRGCRASASPTSGRT